ncbi:hypothetical protein M3Y98_00688100 [Aphelenchoides besseyi]|nr:hypothetical protein M3Y98_00688100 [Aphelenchoides besseyi]
MLPKFVFLTNMVTASISGFIMNILLFYLIHKRTPKEMQSYSRIMRVHCLSDMFYDAIQLTTGVHANPIGGKVYMMLQGFVTHVDLTLNRYLFDLYFWSILFSIALLPIDFIYRYRSVCHNRDLTNFQVYSMVFIAYFITWFHTFVVSFLFLEIGPSPNSVQFTRELEQFPQWKGDVPSFSVTVLGSTKALSNFVFILCLNSISYGIIIYTFRKIQLTLKKNAVVNQQNSRSFDIQKQVSRILALTAILPLVVICIPCVLTVVLALAQIDMPHFGAFGSAVYVWLSAAKPTATILIVPRYRNYVRSRLFGLQSGQIEASKSLAISTVEGTSDTHIW